MRNNIKEIVKKIKEHFWCFISRICYHNGSNGNFSSLLLLLNYLKWLKVEKDRKLLTTLIKSFSRGSNSTKIQQTLKEEEDPGQGKFDMVVGGQNHGTREQFAVNGYPQLQEEEFWDIEEALFLDIGTGR